MAILPVIVMVTVLMVISRVRHVQLALLASTAVLAAPAPASATWSIVAVDPGSGRVGVAVASCVETGIEATISTTPGVGAAVTQGLFDDGIKSRVQRRLEAGKSATEIVDVDHEAKPGMRQVAAVTIDPLERAIHEGEELEHFATELARDATFQGNSLASPDVITAAAESWRDSSGELADRLMLALASGSAAGGDRRCNVDGVRQTAAAAALVVTDADAGADTDETLRLVVEDLDDRRNAVHLLQRRYADSQHAGDGFVPVTVPRGSKQADPVTDAASWRVTLAWVLVGALLLGTLWALWSAFRPRPR